MPPTGLLLTSFLFALQLVTQGKAKEISQAIPGNDLQKHCKLDLGGYGYNLCPLVGRTRYSEISTTAFETGDNRGEGPSDLNDFFVHDVRVALGGLASSAIQPNSLCDEGTWVCLSDARPAIVDVSNGVEGRSRTPRGSSNSHSIVQEEADSELLAGIELNEDNLDADYKPPLNLLLRNPGSSLDFRLTIFCFEHGEWFEAPTLTENSIAFRWGSWLGCPTKEHQLGSEPIRLLQEPGDKNPVDEQPPQEEQQGEDELLSSEPRHLRPWIAFVVIFTIACLAFVFTALSSPRARHYLVEHIHSATDATSPIFAVAAVKLKPISDSITSIVPSSLVPFRKSDHDLVRWAEEEMALDSDDVMVNGRGAYNQYDVDVESWNGDGMDEYIPLTMSPKYGKGRRVRSYGATPEVETFAERGALNGLGKFFKK